MSILRRRAVALASARHRRIPDLDILHAYDHPLRCEPGTNDMLLITGLDWSGTTAIEVGYFIAEGIVFIADSMSSARVHTCPSRDAARSGGATCATKCCRPRAHADELAEVFENDLVLTGPAEVSGLGPLYLAVLVGTTGEAAQQRFGRGIPAKEAAQASRARKAAVKPAAKRQP